jgi:hypothetical protein
MKYKFKNSTVEYMNDSLVFYNKTILERYSELLTMQPRPQGY